MFGHFTDRFAFYGQSTCRADLHAFAATGATFRVAPRLLQICNYTGLNTASHHIPCMSAFNFAADAHTTGTQNAAVLVKYKPLMRSINYTPWIAIGQANVINTKRHR